ncbi:prolyl-tRNA synthetase [Candidatus Kaiserbacteria bacterium RIFCSPHIGHO2_01_FULL_50_13]|uniref:Proline--tRNA ligase n=1 Tax=Candidatus Kaiserbacteria bacterium RIFCSPLOWO2_01_FULL_50_24 TaxID=1798507 RepID=A0A1F6EJJ7_9BACT|nr:MAG: prolyl-tRNA synthetase [Candidatus Kaiserbacteria bacterium RIFCSPHIGHO2_01_FULL_50_13]OGG73482.1 MAG: prolyl-tRNA synthetase [Candidatus Kaiserbacteria bacterium RIFCSPLOWO2_01_FULL_50_24]OGG80852.1 MAG: prolyl-tRNA synthetase [Candidatus Kaiserbacteria bacterium RIFCSPLOWO2_02_FULL_51_13]
MKQSQLFTKTRREAPKDEVAKNAQLLIRAGYIHKEMAGAYSYLPLGLRVLKNIEKIIREEMNAIGGQEIFMTTLQDPALWKKTDRWAEENDNAQTGLPWFKTALTGGGELGIANTHEEVITNILTKYVSSHRDLPIYAYQFQNKFRNELRAKSGIMRCREFLMKDLYSFNADEASFREFYEKCAEAYLNIFARAGIGEKTYRTFASGGAFSKFSDEFQTVCEAGEDTIYIHLEKRVAVNKEVYTPDVLNSLKLEAGELKEARAIEVGNIFPLATRYAKALRLTFKDESGKTHTPHMGSYGIGLGRLMGAIVEVLSDEKGIVWPREVAPFYVHIISISGGNADVEKEARRLYELLGEHNVDTLYDDRDVRAGEKFADADLIGIPTRLVVSEKTMQAGGVEVTLRGNGHTTLVPESEVVERLVRG